MLLLSWGNCRLGDFCLWVGVGLDRRLVVSRLLLLVLHRWLLGLLRYRNWLRADCSVTLLLICGWLVFRQGGCLLRLVRCLVTIVRWLRLASSSRLLRLLLLA